MEVVAMGLAVVEVVTWADMTEAEEVEWAVTEEAIEADALDAEVVEHLVQLVVRMGMTKS